MTSEFMLHGLTGITGIVANVIGGVSKLPLAKFIDIVGRPQGFLLCLACVVLCTCSFLDYTDLMLKGKRVPRECSLTIP